MMVSRTPNGFPGRRPTSSSRDVCRVLFRHRRKMAVVFCSILGLAILGLAVWPRTYVSDARLFVRLGKENSSLDPTATLSHTVEVEKSRENEINSEIEILKSRAILEDVVERLGVDTVLRNTPADGDGIDIMSYVMWPVSKLSELFSGEISPTERAVAKLATSIKVSSPRKSSVILVKCSSRDPKHAQHILRAYLDSYMVWHSKANRTPGSYDFFVNQADLLGQQLELAHVQLRDAKNDTKLLSIEGQRQNIQAQAASIESAILTNERELKGSEAKISALTKAMSELPKDLLSEETVLPNTAADATRNELYKLEMQEAEASSRFTAEHPTVITLRRQVAEMRGIHEKQTPSRSQTTKRLSVVHQGVHSELMAVQAVAAAQRATAESLEKQYDAVQAKIRALNDNEFHITELERRADLLETSYRTYIANREQARIDQALDVGRISNVNLVQPASYIAKASNPPLRLTLAAALVLATLGAIGIAFFCESFDTSLKTAEQVEQELGIPVLLAVPRGSRHEALKN